MCPVVGVGNGGWGFTRLGFIVTTTCTFDSTFRLLFTVPLTRSQSRLVLGTCLLIDPPTKDPSKVSPPYWTLLYLGSEVECRKGALTSVANRSILS